MDNGLVQLITDMKDSLERELNSFRAEVRERFSQIDVRLDRLENRSSQIETSLANINRSLDQFGRRESEAIGTRSAQQQAIDQLAARVTKLEQRLGGGAQ